MQISLLNPLETKNTKIANKSNLNGIRTTNPFKSNNTSLSFSGIRMTSPLKKDTLSISFKGIIEDVGLVKAALSGDNAKAEKWLKSGADVNAKYGGTEAVRTSALHVAVDDNNINLVKLLIDHNADSNIRSGDEQKIAPIHSATDKGHKQIIELLLNHGAEVNITDSRDMTPLHVAALRKDPDIVSLLLKHGADPNAENYQRLTPSHFAAHNIDIPTLKILAENGADFTKRDISGAQPPYHLYRHPNELNLFQRIVNGTDLVKAAQYGKNSIAEEILNEGAVNVNAKYMGSASIHPTVSNNNIELLDLLLRHKADVNIKEDEFGLTPLHIALDPAKESDRRIVEKLLTHGANPNIPNSRLYTPLHYSAYVDKPEITDLLLNHGADVKVASNEGFSALHIASNMHNLNTIELLASKGESLLDKGKAEIHPLQAIYQSAIEQGKTKWGEIIETAVAHLNKGAFNNEKQFTQSLINSLKTNKF